ncbi:MAG: hypothetical protein V9G23_19365 [Giesbergeria sp.]
MDQAPQNCSSAGATNPASAYAAIPSAREYLLGQTNDKQGAADGQVVRPEPVGFRLSELRHHLFVVQHRTRNQVGEKRDEQRVLEQAGRLHETGAAIEQIADLGKSEEGNTQWQEDTFGAIGIQAPTLKHAQQSDEILVVEEQRQVARYTERHHPCPDGVAHWPAEEHTG